MIVEEWGPRQQQPGVKRTADDDFNAAEIAEQVQTPPAQVEADLTYAQSHHLARFV